ncbi:TonB-dependent receptor domain-containing protein [Ancylobacter dichloromethanicus]
MRLQNWLLTVGLRHDWANTDSTSLTNFGDTEQDQDDSAFTGRVGLTYLFDNGIAPYFNYSTSFEPVIGNMPTRARRRRVPADGGRAGRGRREVPAGGLERLLHPRRL